jgi:hypothetical protein
MIISKTRFFLLLMGLVITPFLAYKLIWLLRSEKAIGTMCFVGKSYSGQIAHVFSVINFMRGKDTIWFHSNDNILFRRGEIVPVRYQRQDPDDARVDIFVSIWGDTLGYGGVLLLIVMIMFLHPEVVPRGSKLLLITKKPFIKLL